MNLLADSLAVLGDRLLRAAARVVPADIRRDWLREWQAEVAWRRSPRAGRHRLGERVLLARCLGAWIHAVWLRWERWRLEMLLQDAHRALRALLRRPGFTTTTVLTLTLGLGASTATFSAVRAVLLRPLPFTDPDRLVQIFTAPLDRPEGMGSTSPPDFTDWRHQNRSFAWMGAFNADAFALTGRGAPAEQVSGARVTGGFFPTLGVRAAVGRTLTPDDDPIGSEDVVVLGDALWRRRFGADPRVVDSIVQLDGIAHRVVGVMPPQVVFPLGSELWVPQRFDAHDLATQRGAHYLDVIARLSHGSTIESARADMTAVAARLAQDHPRTNRNTTAAVQPLRRALVGDVRLPLLVLLAAVGLVLLIVCVNVASLSLVRALGRTREMAIRTALGAGRLRLVRGPVIESLLLAAAGGTAGLVLAHWATVALRALPGATPVPLLDQTQLDRVVLGVAAGLAAVVALLVGALPAWHASGIGDVVRHIRQDGPTATGDRQRHRLRGALVVFEMSLAVALLVGAGLLVRTFASLSSVSVGLDASQVQTFTISLPEGRYDTPAKRVAFVDTLLERASGTGGIVRAAAVFGLPFSGFRYGISTSMIDGRTLTDDEQDERTVQVRVVTPDYFATMGIPLIAGRPFVRTDRAGAPRAIIVSESAAKLYWPDHPALGRSIALGTRLGQGAERAGGMVVGVASDVRDFGPAALPRPTVYLPHAQFPLPYLSVVLRARRAPADVLSPMRMLLAELDQDVPMFRVRSMNELRSETVATARFSMQVLAGFAGAAVLLAAIGLYGSLAQLVLQRRREIGIRMALGAGRARIIALVAGHASRLALAGLLMGLALAAAGSRVIRGLLHGVEPDDTLTYGMVSLVLLGTVLLAAWLPARRAARTDPIEALRTE